MKGSNAVLLVLAAVVLVVMVAWVVVPRIFGGGGRPPCVGSDCPPTPTPSPTATQTIASGPVIQISIASSLTKKEWLNEAVKTFNAASKADPKWQVEGKPVVVEIVLEESPVDPGKFDHWRSANLAYSTLNGKLQATILSPADEIWVLKLNKEWRALHGKEASTGKPEGLLRTPAVIAMWQSRAEALGCWPAARPECTWDQVRALAASPQGWGAHGHPEWGKFKFGYSYVGEADIATWTAVLVCMSGLKKYSGLGIDDVEPGNGCGQAMADVEGAKVHSGVSSPALLAQMATGGPEYLDAVTTYEKEVIAFNLANRDKLREPLVAAYPRDGIAVARHPFAILDGAPWVEPEEVEAARMFQRFLMSPEQQSALITVGNGLRPADPAARLGSPIDAGNGANPDAELVVVSLSDVLVVDRIVEVWHRVKKHASIVLVFDKSGSMRGEKITQAVKGACAYVEAMDPDDWLAWMPFDSRVYPGVQGMKRDIGEQLCRDIRSTTAGGETALYDATCHAHDLLRDRRQTHGDRSIYGIVVLSDGQDTSSQQCSLAQLEAKLQIDEKNPTGSKIHTIGIGDDADDALLTKIARWGNGRYWKVKESKVVVAIYQEVAKYF